MGGEIGFQSSPGQGSRFWFTLTLEVKNDAQGTSTADNSVLKDLRLLVVSAPSGSSDGLLEAVSGWVDAPESYCQIWCSGAESSGGLIDVCYFDSVFEFHSGDHLREISESA